MRETGRRPGAASALIVTSPHRIPEPPPGQAAGRHVPGAAVGASVLRALVEDGPALVVCDTEGGVVFRNSAAETLVPRLRDARRLASPGVPQWLSEAHARGAATAEGPAGDREVTATRSPLPDGLTAWRLADVTEERTACRRLADERGRTRFLALASARLLASLNRSKCLQTTAELAAGQLADAAVVVAPAGRRRMTLTGAVAGDAPREKSLPAAADVEEVPGLAEALAGFPPVPSRWVDPALAPQWLLPPGFGELGSLVVTPLPGNGVPAGALVLLRRAGSPAFTEDEEVFARVFAARAGAAISAAVLYADKNDTTEILQRDLLPPPLAPVEGLDLEGAYRPARAVERIGGDFYDVHPCTFGEGEEGTFVVLGDVCGKGPGAAVLTGRIRNTLTALRQVESRHDRLLRLLNDTLLRRQGADARFATMVLADATPLGHGRVGLRLTSAGHPAPLILRGDGRVEEAETRGTLIGVVPSVTSTTWETVLEPGETCLLFSDGVTEARGGASGNEMFGTQRLSGALAECARMPVRAVVERVEMLTAQWLGGNEHDDIALLAVGAPRGSHLTAVDGTGRGRYTG